MPIPSLPIVPGDIERTIETILRLRDWQFDRSWNEAIEAQIRARNDTRTYNFLTNIYRSNHLLDVNQMLFPVAVMLAPESQWDQLESVLVHPLGDNLQDYNELRDLGAKYLERLKKLSKIKIREVDGKVHPLIKLYNGIGYRMLSFNTKDFLQLHCCTGYYYDQICTCDTLQWELLTKFGGHEPVFYKTHEEPEETLKELTLRSLAHEKANGNPILNGFGRCAEIGVSTLIVYNDNDGYSTLIREKSKQVAVYRGDLHVIPSFMFESVVGDIKNEYSVRHNVFREYLEEILKKRELENPPTAASYDWFYNYPDLEFLLELLENKDNAELLFTGIAVDLFSLRPEILTLLLIKTPRWWNSHKNGNRGKQISPIKLNYEVKTPRKLSQECRDRSVPVKLDETLEPRKQDLPKWLDLTDRNIWVPVGAAAFYSGLNVARKKLGI